MADISDYVSEQEKNDYFKTVDLEDILRYDDYHYRQQVEKTFREGVGLSTMTDLFLQIDKDLRISPRDYLLWKWRTVICKYLDNTSWAWRRVLEDEQFAWSTDHIWGWDQRRRLKLFSPIFILFSILLLQWFGLVGALWIGVIMGVLTALGILAIVPTYIWLGESLYKYGPILD